MLKRIILVIVHLLFLILFVLLAKDVSPHFNLTDILGRDSKEVKAYQDYQSRYADDLIIYLLQVHQEKNIINSSISMTKSLLDIPGLKTVKSIDLLQFFNYEKKDNRFYLQKFIRDEQIVKKGEKLILDNPLYQKSYVDLKNNSTLHTIKLRSTNTDAKNESIIEALLKIKKDTEGNQGVKVYLLGPKVASYYFSKELMKQQVVISPITFIVIVCFLLVMFRSFSVVITGIYYMGTVFILCGICILLFEKTISPYTNFAMFFVYVMATSDFIHFCSSYIKGEGKLKERLSKSVQSVFAPCFYTSLTTGVAFLCLGFSDVKVISDFGIYSSIGICISFIVNFYLLPFVLATFDFDLKINKSDLFSFTITNYTKYVRILGLPLLFLTMIVTTLLGVNYKFLIFDDSLYDKFSKNHEMTKSVYTFNEILGHTGTIDLVRKTDSEFLSRSYENKLNSFLLELHSLENINKIRSLVDYLHYIRSEVQEFKIPFAENILLSNTFDMFKQKDLLDDHLSEDGIEEKVTIYVKSLKSSDLKTTVERVMLISDKYQMGFDVQGFSTIRLKMLTSILDGFLYNFIGSLIFIFIIFIFAFKSIRYALIGLFCNTLPISFIGALLILFKIPIEDSLLLMLCSVIGISVDDTIHFLFQFQQLEKDKKLSLDEKFQMVFNKIHFPLLTTTCLFIIVSPSYFLSDLTLMHKMAIFFNIGLATALILDFYLLPTLLKHKDKFNKRDHNAS